MPTTFTHDVFGKDVWKLLPKQLKGIIRENEEVYRIGLHGPDIFFYYYPFMKNKTNQIGHRMHKENASEFSIGRLRHFGKNHLSRWQPICLVLRAILCWTVPVMGMWENLKGKRERLTQKSKQSWIVIL